MLTHWAGPPVSIAGRLRQRCLWCGAPLIDQDLTRVAMTIPDGKTEEQARADGDLDFPTWEVGSWVRVDGGSLSTERSRADDLALGDDAPPPAGACCNLDPGVTN